ncbi:MAG: NAD(+) synthase [Anaerolineales bacterium]|nr:NAD(+) synthase [Anaerolineales bacterium]
MGKNPLEIDAEAACQQAAEFIESKRSALNRDGILLSLSGGLDSAVVAYLSLRGVDKARIRLLYLPDRDSKDRHRKDAKLIAGELGISLQVQDITPILDAAGVYGLLPLRFAPGRRLKELLVKLGMQVARMDQENLLAARLNPPPDSLVSKGNAYGMIKHRMRMVVLYHHAYIHNLAVVGAANKTEWMTGTFSQWGCDHCADIMPILHLYRTQVEDLARTLQIPAQIRNKAADPDVIPGVNDKGELLGSFLDTDQILWGLEQGEEKESLEARFGSKRVQWVVTLYEASRFMRESPYRLGVD